MATPIKRIEKDFLLNLLYEKQLPVVCFKDRVEYSFLLKKLVKDEMIFHSGKPINKLKLRNKLRLMFDFWGKAIAFTVEILSLEDQKITCKPPEFLYKDLDRAFSRVSIPSDLRVQFTCLGDSYDLSFPKIIEYEIGDISNLFQNMDPRNLSGLIKELEELAKGFADEYKLVFFKNAKFTCTEEQILAETGKIFYLPSTLGALPKTDPYPQKRLITEEIFKRYLENRSVNPVQTSKACASFIKAKYAEGIFAEAWIPLLFHEYVIGYIHVWINTKGKPPFGYPVIDTLYQFAKVLAYSLKINGYFEKGKVKNKKFEGKLIDISASGLLFAYPHSSLSTALLPDSEIMVNIPPPPPQSPGGSIDIRAKIVRRYKDLTMDYFGCSFRGMAPDDIRFLFELLYGKPFTGTDAKFLAGQV
ncbi:MAG: PilZ domain-containing protein [Treponema sp.]|jgi:hypothetical protein|nr:PilZ domain-containing protein [Treponema sp.]